MNAVIAIVHEGKKDVTSDAGHQSAYTAPSMKSESTSLKNKRKTLGKRS
jgi:hypothetical protein